MKNDFDGACYRSGSYRESRRSRGGDVSAIGYCRLLDGSRSAHAAYSISIITLCNNSVSVYLYSAFCNISSTLKLNFEINLIPQFMLHYSYL